MRRYEHFHMNIMKRHDETIHKLIKAKQQGVNIDKDPKLKALQDEIKVRKSYERTIKMVTRLMSGLDKITEFE